MNPRDGATALLVFEASPFSLLGTSPQNCIEICAKMAHSDRFFLYHAWYKKNRPYCTIFLRLRLRLRLLIVRNVRIRAVSKSIRTIKHTTTAFGI